MKWFFALNERGNQFENYAKMLKVAVHTAREFTSLEPHFLYDGSPNRLTAWLEKRNVRILTCRSFLREKLRRISEERGRPHYLEIGAGAFLRTEIPRLALENKIKDKFVLYTDVDVMFQREVVAELRGRAPKYFAVAPEFSKHEYEKMNSGVMLMNLWNLRKRDANFRRFMAKNIDLLVDDAWDQTAYRLFYTKPSGYQWDKLPPEFNWKTYWEDNPAARIIHFHGPKPFQREVLLQHHDDVLTPLVTDKYFEFCRLWEQYYEEIESA